MKKTDFLFPLGAALAVVLFVGCASEPPPVFSNDPLPLGNTPSPSLFSSLPPEPVARASSTPPLTPVVSMTPSAAVDPAPPPVTQLAQVEPVAPPPPAPPAALEPAPAPVTTTTIPAVSRAELLKPPLEPFVLGPGDQLDIETMGTVPYRAYATVGLDGKIYYSFLPGVDVWGMTLSQAKSRLEQELSKYISQPQISLSLRGVGSKYIWLLGRFQRPGVYPLTNSITLLEGLSMAGGTAESDATSTTMDLGDLRHSFVERHGRMLPVDFTRLLQQGDLSQNIYLQPDDFVYIPSTLSQQIYVMGAVLTPRAVPYVDHMTVAAALAGAGGSIRDAYLTHIGVVRGSLNSPQLITVNLKEVTKGQGTDVELQPGDIVYVPLTPYHLLADYADLIVTTFVRSWTANQGIRAVQGSTQIGVSIPVGNGSGH